MAAFVLGGLGAVALLLLKRGMVLVTIRGSSMEPTFHEGDRVLVRRKVAACRGMPVVIERPTLHGGWHHPPLPKGAKVTLIKSREWMIKRVCATAGDPVPRDLVPALALVSEERVPSGNIVLLGDNTDFSFDSRCVGYFPTERVLGVVRRRISR
ncbi:S26 family signal peptidase [Spongiactinospora gelatinilytica]|uniref:S26 family signal peptidase n=1 Tax=Spongiactinospora gelatinilytica TaxID=2666298 RepID=A0A2W2GF60_9ACTN|nr:S26 family signal peptidase [Spongiactinospora gelatinilytica]PZG38855.1 S26 family signal peptidase [Spongiactinospora gelatinilytica]